MKDLYWKSAFPEKLQKRMLEVNITAVDLGKKVGVSNSAIGHYAHGRRPPPKTEIIVKLEKALNLPEGWFIYGNNIGKIKPKESLNNKKVSLPILYPNEVPQWIKYGNLPHLCKTAEVIVLSNNLSEKCFLMQVIGDSMASGDRKAIFRDGSYVVVDPEKFPKSGYIVVAQINEKDIKIRQYQQDGNQFFLKAFDIQYPIIEVTKNTIILGVVRQLISIIPYEDD